jgi:hypothetical protein
MSCHSRVARFKTLGRGKLTTGGLRRRGFRARARSRIAQAKNLIEYSDGQYVGRRGRRRRQGIDRARRVGSCATWPSLEFGTIQRSEVRSHGTWTLPRTGAQPSSASPRRSPCSLILQQAARTRCGSSLTASRRYSSRAGRRSGRARHCRGRRRDRACWSCAANLPTACSPTAISVRGIAASTG